MFLVAQLDGVGVSVLFTKHCPCHCTSFLSGIAARRFVMSPWCLTQTRKVRFGVAGRRAKPSFPCLWAQSLAAFESELMQKVYITLVKLKQEKHQVRFK